MIPCPQSPKGLPCLFGPHKTGELVYLACLTCGGAKPVEPCYFTEAGERDRLALDAAKY